jgi:4-deoxy-L-threo-5-hexosulose-uronate ketol-isomerase
MQLRAPITPDDVHSKDSEFLREKLVIENLFQLNIITYVLSHHDRILIGGAALKNGSLKLEAPEGLSAEYLLERREMGLVCLSGKVVANVDGAQFDLNAEDILYIARGARDVSISGSGDIYFTSSMCHADLYRHHQWPWE